MPRKTRMYLPDIPVHVVQRGNNRDACFFCEDEYRYFLDRLREGLGRFGVALHAYALMTNHVHLLMTPRDTAGISRLMQHLGRHYVLYINRQYRRTGTLCEGRHKARIDPRWRISRTGTGQPPHSLLSPRQPQGLSD